jgi:hypothetical protein
LFFDQLREVRGSIHQGRKLTPSRT